MLRLYLNAHSQLAVPAESWFLIDLFAAFGPNAELSRDDLEEAIAMVTTHPRFVAGWHLYETELRAAFSEAAPLSLAAFCDRLFRLETGTTGGVRWGDKTPEYIEHLAALAACFPEAQFVHLIRDGRDVYRSLAQRRWSDRGYTPHELGRYWARCVGAAGRARVELAERFLEVRYEDLVLASEQTLRRVTTFLGVAFEQTMLAAHEAAGQVITAAEDAAGVHEKLHRRPRPDDVQRWRSAPHSFDLQLAAAVMAPALDSAGYLDAPGQARAFAFRGLAYYDHLWRRRARPLLKRARRKLARLLPPAGGGASGGER